ncbi:thioredoxin family protein [Flexivirga sp. B27]
MGSGVVRQVSDAEFDQDVREAPGPVVVEFFATWCGNCRRLAPVLDRLAGEFADRVRFVKINIEEDLQVAARYGVSATPTLVRLRAGEPIAPALVGAQPETVLRDWLADTAERTPADGSASDDDRQWVPADACTLPTADQPLRVAEFARLFTHSLRGLQRTGPTRLRLELVADAEDTARDLIARETDCCDFFSFTLTRAGEGAMWMDIEVPADRRGVLDGLAEQAATAQAA